MTPTKSKGQWLSLLLQKEILGGTWAPGELLPSQNVLAERYQISVATVREAFSALNHQGLVESIQGKGTFVSQSERTTLSNESEKLATRSVGLITGCVQHPYYAELMAGIEVAAREDGCPLLINMHSSEMDDKRESFKRLGEQSVDVFAIGPVNDQAEIDYIAQGQSVENVVAFSCMGPVETHYVSIDRSAGMHEATKYLYDLGHRRITLLTNETRALTWGRRLGFEQAVEEFDLDPLYCRTTHLPINSTPETSRTLALRLLDGADRPTAILAHNDMSAAGILKAAQELGLEVPRDLSIIGFDNIQFAAHASVPLTTVDMRMGEMGHEIIKIVRQIRLKSSGAKQQVLMNPRFVLRDSVGPAPFL
jgi:DNA-binding LacI/PurR family transcriptional regulator